MSTPRGITLPNDASVGLHKALGYELVGVYENVGFKFGAWHPVAYYGLQLQPLPLEPAPPRSPSELAGSQEWQQAMSSGLG